MAEQIACLTAAGIPVMAHIGFTHHQHLGRLPGGAAATYAEQTIADRRRPDVCRRDGDGARRVLTQISAKLTIPTVGIGAGPNCDGQVLVWQDMARFSSAKTARFDQTVCRCRW